jgi:hypothetical protein
MFYSLPPLVDVVSIFVSVHMIDFRLFDLKGSLSLAACVGN